MHSICLAMQKLLLWRWELLQPCRLSSFSWPSPSPSLSMAASCMQEILNCTSTGTSPSPKCLLSESRRRSEISSPPQDCSSYLPLFPEPRTQHDVQVIVINDRLPGPLLNVTTNNVVSVNVFNNLDEPFLLTWYGHGWCTPEIIYWSVMLIFVDGCYAF